MTKSILLTGITVFFITLVFSYLHFFDSLEKIWFDNLFRARCQAGFNSIPNSNLALVCLDDAFYQKYNREPLKRIHIATIVDRVFKLGADFVYLDFFFKKKNSYNEDHLVKEIFDRYSSRLVLPSLLRYARYKKKYDVLNGLKLLSENHPTGYVSFPDPWSRRYITSLKLHDLDEKPVSLVLKKLIQNKELTQENQSVESHDSISPNDRLIPLDFFYPPNKMYGHGSLRAVGLRDFITPIPAYDLVNDEKFNTLRESLKTKTPVFKGKTVLIGDTSTLGKDWFYSPAGRISGIELIATGISSLVIKSRFGHISGKLRHANKSIGPILALIFTFLISFCLYYFGTLQAFLGLVFMGLSYLYLGFYLFTYKGLVLTSVLPIVAVCLCFIYGIFRLNQKWTGLGIYVSKSVRKKVLSGLDTKGLKKKRVALLFADIRGFTRLSDTLDSEIIISMLNDYFDVMAQIITRPGIDGTLDKFMGDGIMAFFGDPMEYDAPEQKAVNAGVEMREAFKKLKIQWIERGYFIDHKEIDETLGIGIGITEGLVHVGNIGSPNAGFMDYTCIGREVNLAARLEGMAPPNTVLVCEQVHEKAGEVFKMSFFGDKMVKGFETPVKVYQIL